MTPERKRVLDAAHRIIERKGKCTGADLGHETGLSRQALHRHLKALKHSRHLGVAGQEGRRVLYGKGVVPRETVPGPTVGRRRKEGGEYRKIWEALRKVEERLGNLEAQMAARTAGPRPATAEQVLFTCEKCGKHLSADPAHRGRRGLCPKCGTTHVVPSRSTRSR